MGSRCKGAEEELRGVRVGCRREKKMGNWRRDGEDKFTSGGMVVVEGKRGREVKKKKKEGSTWFGRAKLLEGERAITELR